MTRGPVHGGITAVLATVALLALGVLVASGALPFVLFVVLLWFLLRRRARVRVKPETETDRLKLALLRARLAASDAALALKDPDIARAVRDYAAGKITREDYEMALDVAGQETHERRTRGRVRAFRFH